MTCFGLKDLLICATNDDDSSHEEVKNASDDDGEEHEAQPDDDALLGHRPVLAVVKELADGVEQLKEQTVIRDLSLGGAFVAGRVDC